MIIYRKYLYLLEQQHLHIGGNTHLRIDTFVCHIDATKCVKGFPHVSQHDSKVVWILNATWWKGIKGQHGHGVRLGWIGKMLEIGRGWRSKRCIGVFGNKHQDGGSFENVLIVLEIVVCLVKRLDDIVVILYRP